MSDTLVKSNHDLTRLQLYIIVEMVITSGISNMVKLHALKAKYDAPFFVTKEQHLTDAQALPGEEQITNNHVILRDELLGLAEPCCANFRALKVYIKSAYSKTQQGPMFVAAGGRLYPIAMNQNWDSLKGMNTLMISFTTNTVKVAALLANNNMNSAFPAKVLADKNAFNIGHGLFMTARQTSPATTTKITADNLCYTDIVEICEDAQVALEGFPELQKLFVIATLKDLVAPPGSASYKLQAKLNLAFTTLPGLLVTIQEEGQPIISLTTDPEGYVIFENINPANYTVKITGPGLISQSFLKDVDTGTNAHTLILMEPVPPPPPPTPTV